MRYLKLFEAKKDKKDWGKMILEIESELRNLINLNTDITMEHIKDISASALDIFRDQEILYNMYLDSTHGEQYVFLTKEDGTIDIDEYGEPDKLEYKESTKFYKSISTKKNILLVYEVDLYIKNDIDVSDPKITSLQEEINDIKNRCNGEGIKFEDIFRMGPETTIMNSGENRRTQEVRSISLFYYIKLDTSKIEFDYRKVLSQDSIADFDRFVSMYKIPKDGEKDLIKLMNSTKKKKKKKD